MPLIARSVPDRSGPFRTWPGPDLSTLCEQAALSLDKVRAGAKEPAEALRSTGA